jgi:hypothetical protein
MNKNKTVSAHTPGPWASCKPRESHTKHPLIVGTGFHNGKIATMGAPGKFWSTPEREQANADRIVACVNACEGINPEAVPDLVAALEDALLSLKRVHVDERDWADNPVIQNARAALEKARG